MKFRILLAVNLLAIASLGAQVRQWTLEECVAYAVENNLTIQQMELDFESILLDESDAVNALLPDLNAQLRTGGNTGLTFDPTTNAPVTTTIITATGNATSTMNLFDGLRNVYRIQRARINVLANQYRIDNLKDDIRINVATAFLQILSNKETLKALEAQYLVTQQDLQRTEQQVEAGVLPRGDLLEVQATAAGQEQQIVNARNQVMLSRISLAQLLQITDYDNFDVVTVDYDIPASDILQYSPKVIFDKAVGFRNDIKLSETGVDLAQKDLQIAKGAYFPTLGAFFNYNTRYSDQTRDPLTGGEVSFADQLWLNDGISYGAQVNIPIFNGFATRNNVKRRQIDVKKAEIQLEQDKLALESTINTVYADVSNAATTYESAQKTLEARRTAYDYAKERYEVGLMNAFDFGQAQARLDSAQAEVIRSKYAYIFRIKVLEFYFGLPISIN
ncbi:TolC family protein [Robiginitalea sp. M366]|uniref:TolC family protein n=1 Tax=Robiginitalea aestuariiviva TaxID=3036903 RepID=UPI00240D4264|nr:TolC family protein [Robiginitalea aestuariiviva]MDG1570990.1 TolC family protein [Robiginitalea aestuariiviva]